MCNEASIWIGSSFFVQWHINLHGLFKVPKSTSPNVNLIAQLEFELAYFNPPPKSSTLAITPRGLSTPALLFNMFISHGWFWIQSNCFPWLVAHKRERERESIEKRKLSFFNWRRDFKEERERERETILLIAERRWIHAFLRDNSAKWTHSWLEFELFWQFQLELLDSCLL